MSEDKIIEPRRPRKPNIKPKKQPPVIANTDDDHVMAIEKEEKLGSKRKGNVHLNDMIEEQISSEGISVPGINVPVHAENTYDPSEDINSSFIHNDLQRVSKLFEMDIEKTENKELESREKGNKNYLFYSKDHYWEDVCKPQTLVVAKSLKDAEVLLTNEIKSFYTESAANMKRTPLIVFPMDTPGVCILSIGLGELHEAYEQYKDRPIVFPFKSESNNTKVFYCNTHYSSQVTHPVSVIIAGDNEEATYFMLRALKELGAKDTRELEIIPVDMTNERVYFLGNKINNKIVKEKEQQRLQQQFNEAKQRSYSDGMILKLNQDYHPMREEYRQNEVGEDDVSPFYIRPLKSMG